MNTKKILSTILAASMAMGGASMFSISASAVDSGVIQFPFTASNETSAATLAAGNHIVVSDDSTTQEIGVTDKFSATVSAAGVISLDGITPNQTIYVNLGTDGANFYALSGGKIAYAEDLGNINLFSVRVDDRTGTGKTLLKSVTQVGNKSINGSPRSSWLKIVVAETTSTTELQAKANLELKARKDATTKNGANSRSTFKSGDILTGSVNLWISNQAKSGSDNDVNTGDRVYFDPAKNDSNVIIWGDDRAALKFDADSDTSKFYGRLSTKNDSEIYTTYGDPANADLWFYDFVSNPTVPSTSRATLTLGIPWEDDDTYVPDPAQCFIYQRDADGNLSDVTSLFTYSEDDQEIPGWSIKTRQLGTYIVSDAELDIEVVEEEEEDLGDVEDIVTPVEPEKVIPDTGASDMVNVAVAAAIVSLAAAGAVAFKKASK